MFGSGDMTFPLKCVSLATIILEIGKLLLRKIQFLQNKMIKNGMY